jgi:outer membrane receptor protein involved in Fe transport
MQRKLLFLLLITALVPGLMFASGKIKGKVVDAGSGEPLVGANVVIVGTSMGAATNVSGEYTVLNIPAGTYALKTSYVGYQAITLSNIRVNNDLTTEANFQLPAEGVTVGTVEIVAERPLVNKSATSAVRIIDAEFFDRFPGRGVNSAVAIQPGVVSDAAGNLYIRGGRADETGFALEGVSIVNPLFGGSAVTFSAEAVEQIQVMAGSFGAEYGNSNGGIISSQLRTGDPDQWKLSLLSETDRFTGNTKKALGGYSYGYSDYTGTISGPVLSRKIRFFGSVENAFFRDPDVRFWDGINVSNVITDPTKNLYHPNTTQPDTLNLVYPAGNRTDGMNNRWSTAGTLAFDLGSLQVRAGGAYTSQNSRNTTTLGNIFNSLRNPLNVNKNGLANVKLSYVLSQSMFAEANLNYFNNSAIVEDPYMLGNFDAYGDSVANAALGFYLKGPSTQWDPWSLYGGAPYGTSLNFPGTLQTGYQETKQSGLGGRLDFTAQLGKHALKIGGEYTRYTIRRFVPGTFARYKIEQQHLGDPATTEKLLLQSGNGADLYGYDIFGNELTGDVLAGTDIKYFGPPHPVFAGIYVEDKIEFSDLILNLGLRYDRIDPDSRELKDPTRITFNDSLGVISAANFLKTPVTSQISPRIGFSFPVTDRTVFHAQFGKYVQETQLRNSYFGLPASTQILKGGFFVQGTSGYGLRPERTTSYEIGFAQQVSDMASFDVTAFYKDVLDQITYTQILPAAGATQQAYPSLVNGDFATTKGVEFKFTLRRTNRVQAQVNYTFSDARGTGSNPTGLAGAAVTEGAGGGAFVPVYIFATTFNQPQRGSILLDYRFAKGDGGPVLQEAGLNVLMTFNGGTSFTRIVDLTYNGDVRQRVPIEAVGSSTTPWVFQIDARLDKAVHIGPLGVDFYVYVINLLNTQNAVTVFNTTGDPKDNGWLSSANGAIFAQSQGQKYVDFYNSYFGGLNSGNFGPPRQIRFGLRLDY